MLHIRFSNFSELYTLIRSILTVVLFFSLGLFSPYSNAKSGEEKTVTILGDAAPSYLQNLINLFNQQDSSIKVVYQQDKDQQISKILRGEAKSNSDILMIGDATYLWKTKEHDLWAPLNSSVLQQNIPAYLRDKDNKWFMLTKRARVIYFNPQFVQANEVNSYEKLGDPKWKDKLCLRDSRKHYNKALVSFLIEKWGVDKTQKVLKSWMNNNPRISNSDKDGVLKDVHDGKCWVGLANTYYYGHFLKQYPDSPIKISYPDQDPTYTHINGKFYGVFKDSVLKEEATRFLEFFSSQEGQLAVTNDSFEFPVNPSAPAADIFEGHGPLIENKDFNFEMATVNEIRALKMMLDLGWN